MKTEILYFSLPSKKPITNDLHTMILSAFSYMENIAVIVPNAKIFVLNKKLEILKTLNFEAPFVMFEKSYTDHPDLLILSSDHRIFVAEKKEPFTMKRTILSSVIVLSHSPDYKKTVVGFDDGSICIYSIHDDEVSFIERITKREEKLTNVFWLNSNQVCMCFIDGVISIFSIKQKLYFSRKFVAIARHSDSFYSYDLRRLYFVTNSCICSVSFSEIFDSLCVTSDSVRDIITEKIVFNEHYVKGVFPIRGASLCPDNESIIVYGKELVLNENHVKKYFDFAAYCNDIIVAFREDSITLFTKELKKINEFKIHFKPIHFSSGYNKVVGFSDKKIAIVSFGEQMNPPKRVEYTITSYSLNQNTNVSIIELSFLRSLSKVVCCGSNIFALFDNLLVVKIPTMESICNSGISIWSEHQSSLLFIQTKRGIQIHFDSFVSYLEQSALASADGNLISLAIDDNKVYSIQDFAFYLLKKEFNNSALVASFIKATMRTKSFNTLINKIFTFASQTGLIFNIESFFVLLDDETKKIVIKCLSSESQNMLIQMNIDFVDLFDSFVASAQALYLYKATPSIFQKLVSKRRIIDKIPKDEANTALKYIVDDRQWSKAIRFSFYTNTELAPLLVSANIKGTSLDKCVKELEDDSKEWNEFNEKIQFLRYLGCAFIIAGHNTWGIASFIVGKDEEKIKSSLERFSFPPESIWKYFNK